MSNSNLVSYTKISPNHSGKRTYKISRITPHCVVGECSVETLGDIFFPTSKKASCNYGIGTDGRILLCVDECNRSWCSSSNDNDQRAVTIECASATTHPYTMNSKVYASLIDLCVDICRRNGKKRLLWFGDKNKTLAYEPKDDEMVITVHRWFANKACPGDWLYSRLGDLAAKVTAELSDRTTAEESDAEVPFLIRVANVASNDVLNIRKAPNASAQITGRLEHDDPNAYTIVEVKNGWGRLKSGIGWINLFYTKKA